MTRTALTPRIAAAMLLAGICLPATAAQAAPGAVVSTAPGRIVVQVDDGAVLKTNDGSGADIAIALPDGASLLLGTGSAGPGMLYATKIDHDGAVDRSFGTHGVAKLPAPGGAEGDILQVLRQPDGKLLIVSARFAPTATLAPSTLRVTRLNADLTPDAGYGSGGSAVTAISEGCGACTPAALQPDGALVLTGTTGTDKLPPATPDLHWAVTRLTPAGAVDAGFGSGGIATIAASASRAASTSRSQRAARSSPRGSRRRTFWAARRRSCSRV